MSSGELILYTTEDGLTKIQLRAEDSTIWLTQLEIAELFQTSKQNVSLHIKNIINEGELSEKATVKESLTVQIEGERKVERKVLVYNLDIILALGYRVSSLRGTQFRQWATTHLREYLIKGFVMDDERLKEPGGWDYFDELLARIKEIRTSEKRFYQKVKDLYALSTDYKADSTQAHLFFKTVQNKMVYAVTGKTAAELIVARANPALPNMGLTSWTGSRVRKQDITISKNYLQQSELESLSRIVTMFLDYAEDQTQQRQVIYMKDWEANLDKFLNFNNRAVLSHAGKISHGSAEKLVHEHYDTFDNRRKQAEQAQAEAEALEDLEHILSDLEKDQNDE